MKSNTINSILFILIAFAILIAAGIGNRKQEKVNCLQWQNDAKIYTNYYLTQAQKEQCDTQGVVINAPVR